MTQYLTRAEFGTLSVMPGSYLSALEIQYPGFVDSNLAHESARIDARLGKRYAVPFAPQYPLIVQNWLARIVTLNCFLKRGFNPTDEQAQLYTSQAEVAFAELKEAADAEAGLFDLPLRADLPGVSGVSKGAVIGYSETSPHVWKYGQRQIGNAEDESGGGTFR